MAASPVVEETVCSCCGWTIPAHAPAFVNDTDYATPRVFCRRCYVEARPLHEETVCCCCGRSIPSIAPVIINDTDYLKPRVFCRRCYAAAPRRDTPVRSGSSGETNGSPDKR